MAFANTSSARDQRVFRHIWRISPKIAIRRWGSEYMPDRIRGRSRQR